MKPVKPSGYRTAQESTQPGYLAKRMQKYRDQLREQAAAEAKRAEEAGKKVRQIKGAK